MVEIKRSKKKMRGNVKILIVIFLILVFGKGISQNVIFVEPPNVQRAMESYQKSFEKNEMVDGFRIQYFFTNDRREMEKVEKEFRRSEEHTSELQSRGHLVCRLLLEKKKTVIQMT